MRPNWGYIYKITSLYLKKKNQDEKTKKRLRDIKDNIGSTDNTRISMVDQTIILN